MARISPYLQMLLLKKRPDQPLPDPEIDPARVDAPTVPLRPTQPIAPITPVAPPAQTPTVPVKPRSRVEEAADVVHKYDQGLHPDPKTGEWVPHKRSRGLEILEGIGNVAASGFGVNLQSILHPRGTPESRARRALSDEMGVEDQDLQRRGAEANINRDDAYTEHLKKIQEQAGIPLTPREPRTEPDREVGGTIIRKQPDGNYKVVYEAPPKPEKAPKPEKVEPEVPDTTGAIAELEQGFRKNEQTARAAADKAEAQAKTYIQQQQAAKPDYDPNADPNAASMIAEAKRQRDYAEDQRKRADDLAIKKVEAGNKQKKGGKKLDPTLETRIRALAAKRGLDPDTAVERALARQ